MSAEKEINHLLDQLCSLKNRTQDLKTIKAFFVLTMTNGRPDMDEELTNKIFIRMFETFDEANNRVEELEHPTKEMLLDTRKSIFSVGSSLTDEKVIYNGKKKLFIEMMQEIGTNPGAKLSVETKTGLAARHILKEVTPS